MPRKVGTAKLAEFDVRITPSDGLPITREHILETDLKESIIAIVAEEGGTPECRLHYHLYIKAKLSETTLAKICSKLGRATDVHKGNAVFSIRAAHEHTIGYVVKNKQVIYHNQDQTVIDQYFEESDQYKRDKESAKKRSSRLAKKTLRDIVGEVEVDTHTGYDRLVRKVLDLYHKYDLPFPSRSSLETAVMKRIYPFNPEYVSAWYVKNFNVTLN